MDDFTLRAHLLLCAQKSKTFTNAQLLEFTESVIAVFEEMAAAKADKIDAPTANNLLAMDTNGNMKDSGLSIMTAQEMKASINSVLGVSL